MVSLRFEIAQLERFPSSPGVYIMKNASEKVLYVGKAKNLKARVKQYFALSGDSREMIPHLVADIAEIDTIVVFSEKEALLLENTLIKKHQPKYNVVLKDDKNYFSLMINHKHRWPMIRVVRFKGKPPKDALYFGPYTKGLAARETLELLRHLFPLRQCSDRELVSRKRPCILHGLKRCIAPCVAKCTHEQYDHLVKRAKDFLSGHDTPMLKELYKEMEKASEALQFERADALFKTIQNIEATLEKQKVVRSGMADQDIIGFYRQADRVALTQLFFREGKLIGSHDHLFTHTIQEDEEILSSFLLQKYGEIESPPKKILLPIVLEEQIALSELFGIEILSPKRGEKREFLEMARKNAEAKFHKEKESENLKEQLLMQMEEKLLLTNYPERIECFDNSNLAGSEPVSVLVTFFGGEKEKSSYRKYKIKPEIASDDYGALREVLTRRYKRAKEEDNLPDTLLIDGGRGHLNVALVVLSELDVSTVDVIAIAKEESKHTRGVTLEKIYLPQEKEPIELHAHSPLLFFLQKIRDEAHRFAITFQRARRGKKTISSALDTIPGIGKIKRQRLLSHFGSVKRIFDALPEELLKVKGITKKDVETIQQSMLK